MSDKKSSKSQLVMKMCVMGEGGVGKTTLTKRIITEDFDASTEMTIGVDFHELRTEIFDPLAPEDADDVDLIPIMAQVWDFAGEQRFRFMLPRYCKGAMGALLCYDLTRFTTTKYLHEWYDIWKENAPENAPLILVGTKADMVLTQEDLELAMENTKDLAEELNINQYYIISSKSGKNIHMLTNDLLNQSYIFSKTYVKP